MISAVEIGNFKAFETATARFAKLTLILGENGIGKSTIVQSLLLTKQSLMLSTRAPDFLYLNGPLVKIGNGSDALRQNAEDERIVVSIALSAGDAFSWSADYLPESDILPLQVQNASGISALRACGFRYLSADRVGPQLVSPFSQSNAAKSEMDERGTNALGLLHFRGDATLPSDDPRVPDDARSKNI